MQNHDCRNPAPRPAHTQPAPATATARCCALAGLLCALGLPRLPAAELVADESQQFMGSGGCVMCHDSDAHALRDARGNDLSIVADWRSTMMANSFRDPYWRAKVEREVEENPGLQALIEDKCTRCHAPMANAQRRVHGAGELSLAAAHRSGLATDGVSCTLCHQIQQKNLGRPPSFTGNFTIGRDRLIFGPYPDDEIFPMPMRNHIDYTPVHGAHMHQSALCATCHTLYTPTLNGDGQVVGEFPEQTPYLEWRASSFAREGKQCQDCHMPRVEEPVRISARPPWLETTHQPFWRHAFVGGNTLVPAILADHTAELATTAEPAHFTATRTRAAQLLRDHSARLRLRVKVRGRTLLARLEVANRTGHKLPTGFPSRRAWLRLTVTAADGTVLFESGAHRDGRLVHEPASWQPHHLEITKAAQTQVYEAVMADTAGNPTTTLLRAASYLKDNRLPPRGFPAAGEQPADVAVHGSATEDPDFARDGSGTDTVRYRIPLGGRPTGPLTVRAELLYQPLKPDFADHLFAGDTPAVKRFEHFHRAADRTPQVVQAVQRKIAAVGP